jgi:uncharacterized membrane protein YdbT with pleckstrin-like domain
MAYPTKLLNEGEQIVLALNEHWVTFLKCGAALLASLVFGIVLLSWGWEGPPLFLAGLLVLGALGWCAHTYATWISTDFVITTDRLIYRSGLLSKRGIEIPLERVNTVLFNQSLFERMLGAGDLVIESAGESGQQNFSNVRKPSAVQNEIYKAMEANENRKFDRIGSHTAAPHPGPTIPSQIAELDALRQQGVLSQEEFDTKKQQLLDKM